MNGLNSQQTKRAYAVHLSLFCRFHHTNPDALVRLNPRELKNMVITYILDLKNKSKNTSGKPIRGETSVNSIKTYVAGIKSFLDEHEISLPWKKIVRLFPEEVTNDYRSYTRSEISKLLSVADLRDRCIILLMASSGIRVGGIPPLTIESLKTLDEGLSLITVYADSKKSRYVTLVTPECMSSIEEYLELRKMRGEKLTQKSYLFRDKYAIYSKRINSPTILNEITINAQVRKLIRKAGLPFQELQPDHAARKFFNTALVNSEVDPQFKQLMMGHDMRLDRFYYDQESENSRKKIVLQYMKAVDALTINDEYRLRKQIANYEHKLKDVPKVEKLQEQLASRIIEQDSIKLTVEKLQKEKEAQGKQMRDMRDMIDNMLDEMMTKLQNAMIMSIQQHPELENVARDILEPRKMGNKTYLMPRSRYSLLSDSPKNQADSSA